MRSPYLTVYPHSRGWTLRPSEDKIQKGTEIRFEGILPLFKGFIAKCFCQKSKAFRIIYNIPTEESHYAPNQKRVHGHSHFMALPCPRVRNHSMGPSYTMRTDYSHFYNFIHRCAYWNDIWIHVHRADVAQEILNLEEENRSIIPMVKNRSVGEADKGEAGGKRQEYGCGCQC